MWRNWANSDTIRPKSQLRWHKFIHAFFFDNTYICRRANEPSHHTVCHTMHWTIGIDSCNSVVSIWFKWKLVKVNNSKNQQLLLVYDIYLWPSSICACLWYVLLASTWWNQHFESMDSDFPNLWVFHFSCLPWNYKQHDPLSIIWLPCERSSLGQSYQRDNK